MACWNVDGPILGYLQLLLTSRAWYSNFPRCLSSSSFTESASFHFHILLLSPIFHHSYVHKEYPRFRRRALLFTRSMTIYIFFWRTQTSHINRLASESWTMASTGRGTYIHVSSLRLWRTYITSYFIISMTSRYGIVIRIRTIFGGVSAQ